MADIGVGAVAWPVQVVVLVVVCLRVGGRVESCESEWVWRPENTVEESNGLVGCVMVMEAV